MENNRLIETEEQEDIGDEEDEGDEEGEVAEVIPVARMILRDSTDNDDSDDDDEDDEDDEDEDEEEEEDYEDYEVDDDEEEDYEEEEAEDLIPVSPSVSTYIADGRTLQGAAVINNGLPDDLNKLGECGGGNQQLNGGEIDGLLCPICFQPWTNSGEHRICCLPCGHLYGLSCIKKWLQLRPSSRKCPQCNNLCTFKDVRVLYTAGLCVADEKLHKEVRLLKAKCAYLEQCSHLDQKTMGVLRTAGADGIAQIPDGDPVIRSQEPGPAPCRGLHVALSHAEQRMEGLEVQVRDLNQRMEGLQVQMQWMGRSFSSYCTSQGYDPPYPFPSPYPPYPEWYTPVPRPGGGARSSGPPQDSDDGA